MTSSVTMTGINGEIYKTLFRARIMELKPPVVGLAVAYVSASGFSLMKKILDEGAVGQVRLVTDTKDAVTHPKALEDAVASGWSVRVVDTLAGTFHPKLYVGGQAFDDGAGLTGLSLAITGSANLSHGGFVNNGECTFWSTAPDAHASAAQAWLGCWQTGVPLTTEKLRQYEKYFALRNRNRNPEDLVALGVADGIPEATNEGAPKKGVKAPKGSEQAVTETAASVAWAGLQSFTGDYNLQLEFPKKAALVLRRVLGAEGSIDMRCTDGQMRTFKYKYYDDNGMFRLNIPNSTPLVDWARENRSGIAYVEHEEEPSGLSFEIVPSGKPLMDVVDRSLALGTWGRTSTRLYGWY